MRLVQLRGALAALLVALLFGPSAVRAQEVGLTEDSTLAHYLDLAVRQHPALEAARQAHEAASERVSQARSWPDPVLTYGYFAEEVETALGPQEHRIGLSQQIPTFGKAGLRGEIAQRDASAAFERYRTTHHRVLEEVARAYYEYAYLARSIEITAENLALLRGVEAVARSRYTTGQTDHAHVIKAQAELALLEDRLRSLEDRRESVAAELRAALGVSPTTPLPWPVPLEDPTEAIPDEETVLGRVQDGNPELLSLGFEVDREDRAVSLARRDRIPDVTLGIETIRVSRSDLTDFKDDGQDAWIASVSVPLPIYGGRYRAAIREADARLRSRQAARHDREQRLVAVARRQLFELRDAERRIELYRTSLIPLGESSLEAALTGFRTGKVGFLDVLDAERGLLQFRLDLARARSERGQGVASILARMGISPAGLPEPEEGSR
jgi:outer membrane protein TolC